MTDSTQPALFDWATELSDAQGHVTLSEQEAHEIGARLRRLHSENETLQAGYAAARLEIESLQARIKTMAEEHADELMLAHLDGRMRATQPAHQQEAQEPVMWAMWRESTGWLAESCEKTRDECIANCIEAVVSEGLPPDFAATRGWIPRPLHASPTSQGDALDAARYRWLRDVGDPTWVPFRIRTGYSAAQVDDAIDAARKQGANHD